VPQLKSRLKGFSDLQANIDSPEATELEKFLSTLKPDAYKATIEEINLAGNWMHGTHVAGIAVAGNPYARIVIARIEFGHTLRPDPCPSQELAEKAGDEASFTSYGPTVAVHANGYQVESVIPGGEKLAESGTSMASPQVANLAGKILAVNPSLKPKDVIALIRDTAEKRRMDAE